jgi:calreticulin
VISDWKKDEGAIGEWLHIAGKWNVDPDEKGIQAHPDALFFSIYVEFLKFNNKDKIFVLQFFVKHEQKLDCGDGYLKLLSGDVDQKKFGGDTHYSIMFILSFFTLMLPTTFSFTTRIKSIQQ